MRRWAPLQVPLAVLQTIRAGSFRKQDSSAWFMGFQFGNSGNAPYQRMRTTRVQNAEICDFTQRGPWADNHVSNRRGLFRATGFGKAITSAETEISLRVNNRISGSVAERQGFEPWVGLHPQRFSRPPRSTTPAPLRGGLGAGAFRALCTRWQEQIGQFPRHTGIFIAPYL